jgi:hypothetical protein
MIDEERDGDSRISKRSGKKRQRIDEIDEPTDIKFPGARRQRVWDVTDPLDEMATIGDALSERCGGIFDKTSYGLFRNAMDSLGRASKVHKMVAQSRPVLLNQVFQVNRAALDEHMDELDHNPLFDIAVRKMWTSVCPDCIDTLLVEGADERRPTKWFSDFVVNTVWADELRKAMRSLIAVGYYAVTYSPDVDQGGALSPVVLDPREYILMWTIDQSGRRYPWIAPRNLPISPMCRRFPGASVTTHPRYGFDLVSCADAPPCGPSGWWPSGDARFEAADVYVETWPSDRGEIRSRARSCMTELVALEQMNLDLVMQSHQRSNVPLVTQFDSIDFSNRVTYGMGEGRVPAAAYGDPRAGLAAAAAMGPAAMYQQRIQDPVERAEDAIGMQVWEHAARTSAATKVSQQTSTEVVREASAAAQVTPLRVFDPRRGRIVRGKALQPWERSHLPLPPGCRLAPMQIPDVPKITIEHMDALTATIFAALGCPPELVLGMGRSNARVATSMLTQESLKAAVRSWRTTLARRAELMFWRIFGDSVVQHLAMIADEEGIVVTPERADATAMDMSVTFTFRADRMDAKTALDLYAHEILERKELVSVLMQTYGLPETAFVKFDPIAADRAAKILASRQTRATEDVSGDLAGIGFSDGIRKRPTPDVNVLI